MLPDHLDNAVAAIQLIEAEGFGVILVGAIARELVFDRKLGDRRHRATRDVDVDVRTESWASYEALAAKLIAALRRIPKRARFAELTDSEVAACEATITAARDAARLDTEAT